MGVLAWIVFGAIAGWVASMITGRSHRMGCFANIFIGVLGAMLGGFLVNFFGGRGEVTGFDCSSFGVAILGSVVLLAVTGWFARKEKS